MIMDAYRDTEFPEQEKLEHRQDQSHAPQSCESPSETVKDDAGEELWQHRWGYADTRFVIQPEDGHVRMTGDRYPLCGYPMPHFLPYLEMSMGLPLDLKNLRPELTEKVVQPAHRNEAFCQAITATFPERMYTFQDAARLRHSHGQTGAEEVFLVFYSQLERTADMVFFCESDTDAEQLIQLAVQHNICLVPYGGGTSVSGALMLPPDETRMIVAISTRRMNKLEWIDAENMQACVQAGMSGKELEEALATQGFTCGHEPDSIELSTVGGWISTNASGMKKNRYGNIEDIVERVTLLTTRGLVDQAIATPRAAMGMQLQKLLFGSEGNLGLITKAVLRIHRLPEVQAYASLVFPNFTKGVEFLRELSQTNFVPASIRLVDNKQFHFGQALKPEETAKKAWINKAKYWYLSKVKGIELEELVAATLVMEGSAAEVAYQKKSIILLAQKFGGVSGGSTNGKRGYRLTFAIAYIRDFLAELNILGTTFETTVPWSKIHEVVDHVRTDFFTQHQKKGLPGKPFMSFRVTQIYRTGVCIYFMIGFYAKDIPHSEEILGIIEHNLRQTIIDHGGSISHHHGVGKIRRDFLKDTVSPTSIQIVQDVKAAHDPHNIFGIRNATPQ
jgi:alkyldihydroxyacetonephosphate synthase